MDVRALCYAKTAGFLLSMEEVYLIIPLWNTILCRFMGAWIHNPFKMSTLPYPQPSRSFTMAMPIVWLPSVTEMRFFSLTASHVTTFHPHWKSRSQLCMLIFAVRMACWRSPRLVFSSRRVWQTVGCLRLPLPILLHKVTMSQRLNSTNQLCYNTFWTASNQRSLSLFHCQAKETKIQVHIYTFILHLPNACKLWCADDRMWCMCQMAPF